MFKVVQFKVGDPLQMIFRSRLFLHENHFFVKICTSAGFLDQPLSKFQTLLRHYICPLVMGFNRRWEEGNFAKFGKISSAIGVKKMHTFHLGGATTSLAILTGGPLWVRPSKRLKV